MFCWYLLELKSNWIPIWAKCDDKLSLMMLWLKTLSLKFGTEDQSLCFLCVSELLFFIVLLKGYHCVKYTEVYLLALISYIFGQTVSSNCSPLSKPMVMQKWKLATISVISMFSREQTKVGFRVPGSPKFSKTGTGTKPGRWNLEKREPKPKPRTKPVTSGRKSQDQPGTSWFLNPVKNATFKADIVKTFLFYNEKV